jgi:hypothetical protein
MDKPTIKEFTDRVESAFGKPLNQKAVVAVRDIYRHWEDLYGGFREKRLQARLNPARFAIRFPDHGARDMERLSLLLSVGGLGLLFVYWLDGVVALSLGIAAYAATHRLRKRHLDESLHNLLWKITESSTGEGMAQMAALYIAGILELSSERGKSHWPEYPSGVFTGNTTFIPY